MSEINLPPFFKGQQVICIKTFVARPPMAGIKKGRQLTIRDLEKNPMDGQYYLRFEEIVNKPKRYYEGIDEGFYYGPQFAPVQENFQSISLERVLEKETSLISVN